MAGRQSEKAMSIPAAMKPPNILVFTGEDPSSGTISRFDSIMRDLNLCINRDCYVIYLLTSVQVLRDPWRENALLLVVSSDDIPNDVMKEFSIYIENGGKMLICCSPVNLPSIVISSIAQSNNALSPVSYKNLNEAILCHGRYEFDFLSASVFLDKSASPSIVKVPTEKGLVILTTVYIEVDPTLLGPNEADIEILKQSDAARLSILQDILCEEFGLKSRSLENQLKLTPCHLFTKNEAFFQTFFEAMHPSLDDNKLKGKNIELNFMDFSLRQSCEATPEVLPILYGLTSQPENVSFDASKFFSLLTTKSFGNVLIYGEVMTSTMPVIESLPYYDGSVIIAGCQTHGKGRTGNKWLSPKGCAMFSLHFSCSLSSFLGPRLSFIQHLASLAMVHGIRKNPAFQDLDLRLKWPNDVYYGNQNKIGGVIVSSSVEGGNAHFFVGCGVNVGNSHPTFCINDAIHLYNTKSGKSLYDLTVEEVIAFSLNEFENLVEDFQKQGASAVLPLYYKYWLHKNQMVTISAAEKEGRILGLDDYGMLMVKTDDGEKVILQPDGNSFDLMKNLISVKS